MIHNDGGVFGGQFRTKLVQKKTQWATEKRPVGKSKPPQPQKNRIPPGQHVTKNWPLLDLGYQPAIDKCDWSLSLSGLIDQPCKLTWDDFQALPQIDTVSDIHCVTAWSRLDNHWRGVATQEILALARPKAEARFVLLKSYDGYSTNLPLAAFADSDVLLATHWEGEPLSRDHGGPVRLILPKLYLWKSPKWIRDIRFMDEDLRGFWEVRGYHNEGDPWKEQRYE